MARWNLYVKRDGKFDHVVSLGSLSQIKAFLNNIKNPLLNELFSSRTAAIYGLVELKLVKETEWFMFTFKRDRILYWEKEYTGWKIYGDLEHE